MKIKLEWKYASGEFDTKTMKLTDIPARGKRTFGPDEIDSELCIDDSGCFKIADIHLGNVKSSNALCKEIVRRFNEFPQELKK